MTSVAASDFVKWIAAVESADGATMLPPSSVTFAVDPAATPIPMRSTWGVNVVPSQQVTTPAEEIDCTPTVEPHDPLVIVDAAPDDDTIGPCAPVIGCCADSPAPRHAHSATIRADPRAVNGCLPTSTCSPTARSCRCPGSPGTPRARRGRREIG